MTVAAARIEPAMRFDNTAFSNEVEDGYALSIYAKYTCPRCRAVVGFSKADFEERGPLRRSNLAEHCGGDGHLGRRQRSRIAPLPRLGMSGIWPGRPRILGAVGRRSTWRPGNQHRGSVGDAPGRPG